MGLAASQARFLQLTARKSNIEFEGQQLNQQRLVLANTSAGLYQQQLSLSPPTPPSSTDDKYVTPAYTFQDKVSGTTKTVKFIFNSTKDVIGATMSYNSYESSTEATTKTVYVHTGVATGPDDSDSTGVPTSFSNDVGFDIASGRLNKLNISLWNSDTGAAVTTQYKGTDLTYAPITDTQAYNDDMNKYEDLKAVYDSQLDKINAQTATIQNQDRSLELKMKQIDTEHSSIQTEMDAVQKVIKANLDSSFKTFAT